MRRLAFGLGVLLTLGACRAPLVIAYPSPRDPITSVDLLEPGQTEVSASVVNSLFLEPDVAVVALADYSGFWVDSPYKASVAHAFGPVEVRAVGGPNIQGWMLGGGIGLALPQLGAWTPIVDGGYAYESVKGAYGVETEFVDYEGETQTEVDSVRYAYEVHAPYARIRMVRVLGPRFRLPVALKVNRSLTVARFGLDQAMPRETYSTLTAGIIFDPGSGCLSLGLGGSLRLEQPTVPVIEAGIACAFGGEL